MPRKTQPTRSHSHLTGGTWQNQEVCTEPNVCPEVSEFRYNKYHNHHHQHHEMPQYIHNLHIDYGHLEQPGYVVKDEKLGKLMEDAEGKLIPIAE